MDGFGVNANPDNWRGGQLAPALDVLVESLNARIWRVEFDGFSRWEAVNDDPDPFHFNWTYYNQIYESPEFQDVWSTVAYLNQKNVQVVLAGTGIVPGWMGGGVIDPTQEDEFVEEIVSAVYYARNVRGLRFSALSPLNETDLTGPEGPHVDATQYAAILHKFAARLDALGLGDVRLVVPEIAGFDVRFVGPLFDDPVVMAKADHVAVHSYQGTIGGAYDVVRSSGFPNLNVWVSEWSEAVTDGSLRGGQTVADEWIFARTMADYLLNVLNGGASAALAWDAYENIHEHDGTGLYNEWGMLDYDRISGIYAPKKRFYTSAQFFKFIPPGAYMVSNTTSDTSLKTAAFYEPLAGKTTIVGRTTGTTTMTLTGTLRGVAPSSVLSFYYTNATANLAHGTDIPIVNGQFVVDIPGDTIFTLTNIDVATPVPAPTASASVTPVATATTTPTATVNPGASGALTISFDDATLVGQDRPLNGIYPADAVDWGINQWYLSAPWQQFATKSIGFNGAGPTSARFSLVSPRTVLAIDAYNGGSTASVVTLSCAGNPPVSATVLGSAAPITLVTRWVNYCASATVDSTNGWNTNFDNLVIGAPAAPATGVPTASPTPTLALTPSPTATPSAGLINGRLGNTNIGATIDSGDSNNLNGSRVTTAQQPITVRSMSVFVAGLDSSITNRSYQVAIYADNNGRPGTLVASSATGTLTANSWNTLPISVNLAANTSYWLMYNTNGRTAAVNNMRRDNATSGTGAYSASTVAFGTWPSSFGTSVVGVWSWSIYLTY